MEAAYPMPTIEQPKIIGKNSIESFILHGILQNKQRKITLIGGLCMFLLGVLGWYHLTFLLSFLCLYTGQWKLLDVL